MPFKRRTSRRSNPNSKLKRKAAINRNTSIATRALRLAKRNAQNVEIQHWKSAQTSTTFNNATVWTVDGINMTTLATANGWLANDASGKTGAVAYTIGSMDRSTTSEAPGYRSGNNYFLRSFWIKGRLTCNTTTNSRIRMMVLKVRGMLKPDDLPFYMNGTSPDLNTFTDKGKRQSIATVLYDRVIRLSAYDNTNLSQVRYFNFFRRANTKYIYDSPTEGSAGLAGDPDGLHDIGTSSYNYWVVFATDTTTASAVTVDMNTLVNYVP